MFKRDIKVNYGTIGRLVYQLNKYNRALDDMKSAILSMVLIFEKGKGQTMTSFETKSNELIKKIEGVQKELTDVSEIFQHYKMDMTAIVKPIKEDNMMQVDRNDIYWNKKSINDACMDVGKIPNTVHIFGFSDGFILDDDEEEIARRRRNDDKLSEIKRTLSNSGIKFAKLADRMNTLYKKVQNYENMDDTYEKKAGKLKREYTDFWEGAEDFLKSVKKEWLKYAKGVFKTLEDFAVDLQNLAVGAAKYAASAVVFECGEQIGEDVPDWAKKCYNGTNDTVAAILHDPAIIVEGIAQGVSDSFEEKGAAYGIGYAVGSVTIAVVGDKGVDKLSSLGKGAGAVGGVDDVQRVGEAVKVAGATDEITDALKVTKVSGVADDVAKAGTEGGSTVSQADKLKLIGWKFKPNDELYLKYKRVYDNSKYYNQVTGEIYWPVDDGFKQGTKINKTITEDTIFKRYGSNSGEFLGNATDSFESRALAPHSEGSEIHYYELLDDTDFTAGEAAPWFGSEGGAEQFVKYKTNGEKYTIREMEKEGILKDITSKVEKGEIKID